MTEHTALTFRDMTARDIPFLVEIDSQSNLPPWNAAMFERELSLPFSVFSVASLREIPVGFGVFWIVSGTAQLLQLAVAPAVRRKGVGTKLLAHLLEKAKGSDCAKMDLELKQGNMRARRLYEKLGFKYVGLRKEFYGRENALLMTCDLKN